MRILKGTWKAEIIFPYYWGYEGALRWWNKPEKRLFKKGVKFEDIPRKRIQQAWYSRFQRDLIEWLSENKIFIVQKNWIIQIPMTDECLHWFRQTFVKLKK